MLDRTLFEGIFDRYLETSSKCEVTEPYMLFRKKDCRFWYGDNCEYINFSDPRDKEKCVEEMMENAERLKSGCDKFSIGYQAFGTEMCVCHTIEI